MVPGKPSSRKWSYQWRSRGSCQDGGPSFASGAGCSSSVAVSYLAASGPALLLSCAPVPLLSTLVSQQNCNPPGILFPGVALHQPLQTILHTGPLLGLNSLPPLEAAFHLLAHFRPLWLSSLISLKCPDSHWSWEHCSHSVFCYRSLTGWITSII